MGVNGQEQKNWRNLLKNEPLVALQISIEAQAG
jgi:hypothetical protein